MSAAADNVAWMPAVADRKHDFTIGGSLLRALKARKATTAPPTAKVSKEFYAFHYTNRPDTVDLNGNGTAELTQTGQSNTLTVERPFTGEPNRTHTFRSTKTQQNELECVLIYDEETGAFTIEKVDTQASLVHEPRPSTTTPTHPLPTGTKPIASIPEPEISTIEEDLARAFELEFDDAMGDDTSHVDKDEVPSEGEIVPTPPRVKPTRKTVPARTTTSSAKSSAPKTAAAATTKVAPKPKPIGKSKQRPLETLETTLRPPPKKVVEPPRPPPSAETFENAADEEILDLGFAPPAPKHTFSIALPGSSYAATLLPPPVPPPPPPLPDSDDDDDDDEWENALESELAQQALPPHIEMIEEDDVFDDLDKQLAQEMDAEFGEEDEGMEVRASPAPSGSGPMLNDDGGDLFGDDSGDEDSESEDSDED